MKTNQIPKRPSTRSPNQSRQQGSPRHDHGTPEEFDTRTEQSRIRWPSARELQRVSTTLAKVSRLGMRQEDAGDYFNSGDLAYQLHEIIRATAELLKKIRRNKG